MRPSRLEAGINNGELDRCPVRTAPSWPAATHLRIVRGEQRTSEAASATVSIWSSA
jgi:hypothetical protein